MKRLFLVVAMLVCLCAFSAYSYARTDTVTLLNGVTATGAGEGIRLDNENMYHTISTFFVDANSSVSAVVIRLEGCNDPRSVSDTSAHWVTLQTLTYTAGEITAKQASSSNGYPMPYRRVRAYLVTFTGGTAPDAVTVYYEYGRPM